MALLTVVERSGTLRFALPWLSAGLCLLAATPPLRADSPGRVAEYRVKAAFLYNFMKFVEWPGGLADPSICVLGVDPFGDALDSTVVGKPLRGATLSVRRLRSVADIGPCSLLFVNPRDSGELDRILRRIGDRPILSVGDTERFAHRGGIVNFMNDGGKVRFEINPEAARRANLKISSKLLALALVVQDEGVP